VLFAITLARQSDCGALAFRSQNQPHQTSRVVASNPVFFSAELLPFISVHSSVEDVTLLFSRFISPILVRREVQTLSPKCDFLLSVILPS